MGLLLIDLPVNSTATIFLIDPVTLEQVGELAGYVADPIDFQPSRWYSVDVGDLPAGRYLVCSQTPNGSGWVDTSIGSSPWPVTDGVFSRLNISWIGGLPVVVGDFSATLLSSVTARTGKLPIYWGEDHLTAQGRQLVVDGLVDDLTGATGKLTIKKSDGTVVVDHVESSDVDNVEKRIEFELTASEAEIFDLEESYFFFCQAWFTGDKKITVKRGEVELLDSAESLAPL